MKDLSFFRREYQRTGLSEDALHRDPIQQFDVWFQEAVQYEKYDPNAMVLSTTNRQKEISSRVVLMKGYSKTGFTFFGHYNSKKGEHLSQSSQASLLFYWPELIRQVRIEGSTSKLSAKKSDEYFSTRPRNSQIAAHASLQSKRIVNRSTLESEYNQMKKKMDNMDNMDILRPSEWGGWILTPTTIEFWQGREKRLHDRIEYFIQDDSWDFRRLSP